MALKLRFGSTLEWQTFQCYGHSERYVTVSDACSETKLEHMSGHRNRCGDRDDGGRNVAHGDPSEA
jgi:hypothetical protein